MIKSKVESLYLNFFSSFTFNFHDIKPRGMNPGEIYSGRDWEKDVFRVNQI